ncbi:MAG TPA: 2-amino-4-hydroxy-6-hydroxymethyldihydropteridine diphosphokinase [Terriglobales bacterium]|jgi:2-amino-4-hydroxy-6-hydroxymethyldihydropteridine diphosphokinase|nr:2-amino-4-hydroxy-6-hydroxymethyldihydropteridine diphosphokinase [Terriglobales bacterium]
MEKIAHISLGSNVGDRAASLRAALERLRGLGSVLAISGFYETEPVELPDQPWFLNCVAALETSLPAQDLLRRLLAIEQEMGRIRLRDKGPRLIDLDILLYGDDVVEERGLKIPHPAMQDRRFVLEPLAEIAPNVIHPGLKKTAREMLAELPAGQVVRRLDAAV